MLPYRGQHGRLGHTNAGNTYATIIADLDKLKGHKTHCIVTLCLS